MLTQQSRLEKKKSSWCGKCVVAMRLPHSDSTRVTLVVRMWSSRYFNPLHRGAALEKAASRPRKRSIYSCTLVCFPALAVPTTVTGACFGVRFWQRAPCARCFSESRGFFFFSNRSNSGRWIHFEKRFPDCLCDLYDICTQQKVS